MATEEQDPVLDDSLSDIDMTGLLAKLDEVPEQEVAIPSSATVETTSPRSAPPTCPAGSPKPKINLDALKKAARGSESSVDAQISVGRMFGGEVAIPAAPTVPHEPTPPEEVKHEAPPEIPLPKALVYLNIASERLRMLHPWIPTALGILGGICLLNGLVIIALAGLAWI